MVCPINPITLVGQKNKKYFNSYFLVVMFYSRFGTYQIFQNETNKPLLNGYIIIN